MKKLIQLLFICLIYIPCNGQTKLTPGEIKGKHDTFIIHRLKPIGLDTQSFFVVYSKSNKYNKGIPYSKHEKEPHFVPMNAKRDTHVNDDAIKEIVYQVLNNKLDALKRNKETIRPIFDFKPSGDITDISFGLHANTIISLQEIEEIDHRLRENVKATFTRKEYLQYEAINYVSPTIVF